jgi:hypothetical protein
MIPLEEAVTDLSLVFLACAGANANVPTVMAYQANNIRGHWKRAFCSATLVGFGKSYAQDWAM